MSSRPTTDEQARKRNEFANALFAVAELANRKIPERGEERCNWLCDILNKSH